MILHRKCGRCGNSLTFSPDYKARQKGKSVKYPSVTCRCGAINIVTTDLETAAELFGPYRLQPSNIVTMPKEISKKLHLNPGELFVWVLDGDKVMVRKAYILMDHDEAVGVDVE